jgi:hypothetical protein
VSRQSRNVPVTGGKGHPSCGGVAGDLSNGTLTLRRVKSLSPIGHMLFASDCKAAAYTTEPWTPSRARAISSPFMKPGEFNKLLAEFISQALSQVTTKVTVQWDPQFVGFVRRLAIDPCGEWIVAVGETVITVGRANSTVRTRLQERRPNRHGREALDHASGAVGRQGPINDGCLR